MWFIIINFLSKADDCRSSDWTWESPNAVQLAGKNYIWIVACHQVTLQVSQLCLLFLYHISFAIEMILSGIPQYLMISKRLSYVHNEKLDLAILQFVW